MAVTTLRTRLTTALRAVPPGSLVPVEWVRGLLDDGMDEDGDDGTDLTVGDVAARLGRAPGTVATWCRDGRLPGAYRLHGREWRVPRSALRALRDAPGRPAADAPAEPADLGAWRRVRVRARARGAR